MHPLVRAAVVVAMLTAVGRLERPRPARSSVVPPAAVGGALAAPCGPRTVPDGAVCVPPPPPGATLDEAPAKEPVRAAQLGRPGRPLQSEEEIPRLPERPAELSAYVHPLFGPMPGVPGGCNLQLPASPQGLGADLRKLGHAGLELPAPRGCDVHAIALEHQEGSAEVLFVGELFGTTVATSHLVREAGRLREYVVLYGHLEGLGPAAVAGSPLASGDVLGGVGDTGSPGNAQLYLEVRQVRDGARLRLVDGKRIVDPALTIPCDPRNVLTLR